MTEAVLTHQKKNDLTDPATVQHFMKRAKYVAIKRGYPKLADDFASQVFVYFLEKPDRGATVDQLFIDFLRKTHGRAGTPGNDARIQAERSMAPLDAARDIAGSSGTERSDGDFAFCFRGREAEIYQSYFVDERSEVSIAEDYGVSGSRISQMLKPMKEAIKRQAVLMDGYERMEWDETFLSFQIEWASL